jgi:hypothetical protein
MVVKGSCPAAPLGLRATILGADVAYLRVVAQFFGGGRGCGFGEDYRHRAVSWRGRLPRLAISVRRGKTVKRLPSTSPMRLPAGGGDAAALVGRHRRHVPLLTDYRLPNAHMYFPREPRG